MCRLVWCDNTCFLRPPAEFIALKDIRRGAELRRDMDLGVGKRWPVEWTAGQRRVDRRRTGREARERRQRFRRRQARSGGSSVGAGRSDQAFSLGRTCAN